MEIVKRGDSGGSVLLLKGKIDANSAPQLETALKSHIDGFKASFKVDMSGVTYLSSAGLRAFLSAQKKCNVSKISMTLTGVSKQIQEIFDITGFSGVLTIEE